MNNLLITGVPGVGKTTFLVRLSETLRGSRPVGFITREIRESGTRVGFEIVGCDGSRHILAHVEIRSRSRVGKYGVDVAGFENYLASLDPGGTGNSPVIIDEIGKMECYSPRFRDLITRLLESDRLFIGTIARKGSPFIESIKKRDDVILFELTRENRERLLEPVLSTIRSFPD